MQRPILLALALAVSPGPAITQGAAPPPGVEPGSGTTDVARARDALEQGKALPLVDILKIVQDQVDARIIEVEFEEEGDHYVYEFELITPDGRLLEAKADPVTGRILEVGEDSDDD